MKITIAIPCMEDIPVDFARSLMNLKKIGNTVVNWSVGSLIYASRDHLAQQAIAEKSDYVLWLDSDMVFNSDLLIDLMKDIDEGKDFVSGLYFRRKAPYSPVLYETIRMGFPGEGVSKEFLEYPENQLFEIDACGFGGVLMKTKMLEDVIEAERNCFAPIIGYGEDISFCIRAKKLGYKLWCDSRVKMGHIAKTLANEETYKAYNKMK